MSTDDGTALQACPLNPRHRPAHARPPWLQLVPACVNPRRAVDLVAGCAEAAAFVEGGILQSFWVGIASLLVGPASCVQLMLAGAVFIVHFQFGTVWKRYAGKALPQPLPVAAGQRRLIASRVFANRAWAICARAILASTVRGPASSGFAHRLVAICLAASRIAVATVRVRVAVHRDCVAPHLEVSCVRVTRVETDRDVGLLAVVVDDGHV